MKKVILDMTKCSGCRACEQICDRGAISMHMDSEGFSYPYIDDEKCINCKKCTSVCAVQSKVKTFVPLETFAAMHNDYTVLYDSSSGGVFTALADIVLSAGGVVVGCMFDEGFRARQVIVSKWTGLDECRGSKYVQSDTNNTYLKVEELLKKETPVLYTGTPCQIAGLRAFLGREYENLLTADLVCHGVPSPELFVQHISWLENKMGQKIRQYRFRSKINSHKQSLYYYYYFLKSLKIISGSAMLDPYYFAFLNGKTFRNCCYQCLYAKESRVGDFTFADYWSVEKFHPELKENSGVSILLLNTPKAIAYKAQIEERMRLVPSKLEWIKEINANLNAPSQRPDARNTIYQEIQKQGYSNWADCYCSTTPWKLRNAFGKLPPWLRLRITKLLKVH